MACWIHPFREQQAFVLCHHRQPSVHHRSRPLPSSVADGDTVDIVDDVRGRLRIRIDTPETNKPGYTVGCWGPRATKFAKSTATCRLRHRSAPGHVRLLRPDLSALVK